VLQRLFRARPARQQGAALYQAVTRQARQPVFYQALGAPDTVEGRFELYSLHVILLLIRLRGLDEAMSEISQALFDAYLRALDDALREMGVGDLSVGKKMRKLGEALYGRIKRYDQALSTPDGELAALLARTVYAQVPDEEAPDHHTRAVVDILADYVRRTHAALAAQDAWALVENGPAWPGILR
jgi:cytochrome b pre-mRNA-processing protein 3